MLMYFARHGESEANVANVFANEVGKYHLTDLGRQQAALLAEYAESQAITRLYASPITRAQETAHIVADRLGLSFETRDELREFSVGCFEGTSNHEAWAEYWEVETEWLERGNRSARVGGGESYDDIEARFLPFVKELAAQFGATENRIMLIGHGGTFCCMLPLLLENVDSEFARCHRMSPATAVKTAYNSDGKFTCLSWGEVFVSAGS